MSISQILNVNREEPCAGFQESLVLAVKDCFLESDIRDILIGRAGDRGVVFFSRLCTSLASEKKVCNHCDEWFSQISGQRKHRPIFGIDNFLDNNAEVEIESTDSVKRGTKRARRDKYAKHKEKKYECPHCEKDFATKKLYSLHLESCGCEEVCDQCGALVTNIAHHVRTAHAAHHQKKLRCEHCAKEFKYRSELTVHLTHHTGELNFSCSACGKKFRRAAEARLCERGHEGMFNYSCNICDYKTHKKHHLARHLKSHSKLTPYLCPLCGFKSGRKDNLKQHIEKRHCNSKTSIQQLEEAYPDMYKLHDTNDQSSVVEMKKPDEKIPAKSSVVDTGQGVGSYSEVVHSESLNRYINTNHYEEENKRFTNDMPRYLISEDYYQRYEDRYSEIDNQQRDRLFPVDVFHKMKSLNQ